MLNNDDVHISWSVPKYLRNVINILPLNIKLIIHLSCSPTHSTPLQLHSTPLHSNINTPFLKSSFIKDHYLKIVTQKLGHSANHTTKSIFYP